MFHSALAAAAAATMAITIGASGALAESHDTTSHDTYIARVNAHGVDGTATVALDSARTGGTIKWTLDGLDNGAVTIRMQGGTCEDAAFTDGAGTRTHELLTVSAKAFASDIASKHGVTATIRNNGQLIACVPFTDHV
jgi:ABC-type glycerol-3-phosphate transport system substrate-binding protein